jgi:hypothetical protein
MVFQGNVGDIDQSSSTGRLVYSNNPDTMLVPARDENVLATRVIQDVHVDKQQEQVPRQDAGTGTLQPDQSSSRLTEMLHGVSPGRAGFEGRFLPNCPSAVPSPLHKQLAPSTPLQAMPPRIDSSGTLGPRTGKSIEDHFFMTNEHLDVVGKSNWDQIAALRKDLHDSVNQKHAQIVGTVQKHLEDIKSQVDSINEKTDRAAEQGHNVLIKLDQLFDFVKEDIMGVLITQNEKLASTEQNVKELQMTVQKLQTQQDTTAAPVPTSNSTTSPFPFPDHRSQPSHAGYYGNVGEPWREGMPSGGDHRNNGATQDGQAGHGGNYAQQWGPRNGHQNRGKKEERIYPTNNPYGVNNSGGGGSGQFNNGYGGGYPGYGQQ